MSLSYVGIRINERCFPQLKQTEIMLNHLCTDFTREVLKSQNLVKSTLIGIPLAVIIWLILNLDNQCFLENSNHLST